MQQLRCVIQNIYFFAFERVLLVSADMMSLLSQRVNNI